jgi:hypothetical protein
MLLVPLKRRAQGKKPWPVLFAVITKRSKVQGSAFRVKHLLGGVEFIMNPEISGSV